jgi:hypothetical protein
MKQILYVIISFITLNSFAQETSCSDFKVGTFTYSDPDYADLISVRTDSVQTDTYPIMGWEMTSSIIWLTDCKYEIKCIKVNDQKLEPLIGITYIIEIIDINANIILCRTESYGVTVEKEMIKKE